MTAMTASTSTDSTSLSAIAKVWIAHSLTGPGVTSMTTEPTAVRASASGPNATATSWVTPRATAAAATPAQRFRPARRHAAKVPGNFTRKAYRNVREIGCFTRIDHSLERKLDGDRGQEGRHRRWGLGLRSCDGGGAGQARRRAWRCWTGRSRRARKSPTPSAGPSTKSTSPTSPAPSRCCSRPSTTSADCTSR